MKDYSPLSTAQALMEGEMLKTVAFGCGNKVASCGSKTTSCGTKNASCGTKTGSCGSKVTASCGSK